MLSAKRFNRVVQIPNELISFSVREVTEGIDALGEVTIRLRYEGRTYSALCGRYRYYCRLCLRLRQCLKPSPRRTAGAGKNPRNATSLDRVLGCWGCRVLGF
jgi:hypothetical protein